MRLLALFALLFFGCTSQQEGYFHLQLRDDSIANLTASTPYEKEAIKGAIKGVEVLKLQKVTPHDCRSITVVQHSGRDLLYIHPTPNEKKIAYIEVISEAISTAEKLHVGLSLKEAKALTPLDCNHSRGYITCHTPTSKAISYHFLQRNFKLDKIVLTF